jgi:hypothetical protein
MNQKPDEWRQLLSTLKIDYYDRKGSSDCQLSTLSRSELEHFERESQIILPAEFQQYCLIFGSGIFGYSEFQIIAPNINEVSRFIESNKIIIEACEASEHWTQQSREILHNSYLFGYGPGEVDFLFDLRTYSSSDQSYVIYGIECYSGYQHNFGRDFFAFIRDYCIGKRADDDCPELLVGRYAHEDVNDPRSKEKYFVPLPKNTF